MGINQAANAAKGREAHPLKQGLKLALSIELLTDDVIREAHPLKQGLKPGFVVFYLRDSPNIREAHPLKQGLKQLTPASRTTSAGFERHIH